MSNHLFERKLPHSTYRVYPKSPENIKTYSLHQTHSVKLASMDEVVLGGKQVSADGVYGQYEQLREIAIAIKTADCMPVLLLGLKGFAFIHAGWQGLSQGILLQSEIKSIAPQLAYIGPCIHKESYEVSDDFNKHFPHSDSFIEKEGKHYFDLIDHATKQLEKAYFSIKVIDSEVCTFKDEKFFSYRRNKTEERNWNIFTLSI